MARHCLIALAFVLVVSGAASAQRPSGWAGRSRIGINAGAQVTGDELTQNFTLTKNVESAPVSVTSPFGRGMFFDGGATIRVRRKVGIGIAASYFAHDRNAAVSAQIPHPLFFNQRRAVAGTVAGLAASEAAVHVDAAYLAPS